MKNYELNCLISSILTEEELKKTTEKISSIIQKEDGLIVEIEKPVQKTIAYPIEDQKEAFLVSFAFSLKPEKVEKVKKEIKKIEDVLRFSLTIKKEIKKHPKKKTTSFEKKDSKETPKKSDAEKLKEIDEKLNKILE